MLFKFSSSILPLSEKLLNALPGKILTMIMTLPARSTKPFRRCRALDDQALDMRDVVNRQLHHKRRGFAA